MDKDVGILFYDRTDLRIHTVPSSRDLQDHTRRSCMPFYTFYHAEQVISIVEDHTIVKAHLRQLAVSKLKHELKNSLFPGS